MTRQRTQAQRRTEIQQRLQSQRRTGIYVRERTAETKRLHTKPMTNRTRARTMKCQSCFCYGSNVKIPCFHGFFVLPVAIFGRVTLYMDVCLYIYVCVCIYRCVYVCVSCTTAETFCKPPHKEPCAGLQATQAHKLCRLTSHVIPLKALFYVGLLETGELIRLSSISHTGAPLRGPSLLVSAKSMILPHIRAYLLGKVRLHRYICL
jgi:hypothetical protein